MFPFIHLPTTLTSFYVLVTIKTTINQNLEKYGQFHGKKTIKIKTLLKEILLLLKCYFDTSKRDFVIYNTLKG